MIAVIAAHRDGKAIQGKSERSDWTDVDPLWNFALYGYRIKPEPLEYWVNIYPSKAIGHHETKDEAVLCAHSNALRVAVHMKEVES
jgi:hypothetical protein